MGITVVVMVQSELKEQIVNKNHTLMKHLKENMPTQVPYLSANTLVQNFPNVVLTTRTIGSLF